MKKSVTKKLTQKICLALACGLVFAAGGQMSKAEAGGGITHLYGVEELMDSRSKEHCGGMKKVESLLLRAER